MTPSVSDDTALAEHNLKRKMRERKRDDLFLKRVPYNPANPEPFDTWINSIIPYARDLTLEDIDESDRKNIYTVFRFNMMRNDLFALISCHGYKNFSNPSALPAFLKDLNQWVNPVYVTDESTADMIRHIRKGLNTNTSDDEKQTMIDDFARFLFPDVASRITALKQAIINETKYAGVCNKCIIFGHYSNMAKYSHDSESNSCHTKKYFQNTESFPDKWIQGTLGYELNAQVGDLKRLCTSQHVPARTKRRRDLSDDELVAQFRENQAKRRHTVAK